MDREDRHRNRRERESPSFSSTLLDAIYHSIDQGSDQELLLYRQTMKKKQYTNFSNGNFGDDQQALDNLRRACLIEKLMEKKVTEKVVVRRKSGTDFERKLSRSDPDPDSLFLKSNSSSSDSSSGGGFSSSEAESVYGAPARPKPIRTSISAQPAEKFSKHEKLRDVFGNQYQQYDNVYAQSQQKPKHEGGFVKTKSRALKIYSDLKKVKQPISPGGKLSTFLNSLFNAGNAKKAKISSSRGSYDEMDRESKSAQASTCSSASSFSRSCLSKTPSSRGKLSNGMKRSVRFYPVSVIVDEDCQPCGHKSLYEEESNPQSFKIVRNNINEELKVHLNEKNRRVEEAARDLLKNYQKKVECELDLRNVNNNGDDMDMMDEDDDEDAASYASSDLFELDNLSAIGIERYCEELPVYGTTHFDTNRAIANGLIM